MKPFSKKTLKADETDTDPYAKAFPPEEDEALINDPGSKEISKYDPAYEFLIKLVNLVVKEGVPAQEVKELSLKHPFVTVNDAGDLAAKIWTLATEKYNIPREWLIKKLPESKRTGSQKIANEDLTQFALDDKQIRNHFRSRGTAIEDVLKSLPNFKIEYINKVLEKEDPSLKDNTRGFYDFNTGTLYINPRMSVDDKRLTIIHEIEHAIQDSVGELPVHSPEDLTKVKQTPYLDRTFEWGARQQQFNSLKARGLSLSDIEAFIFKRNVRIETMSEWEIGAAKEAIHNEVEQMEDIYNEMMPESIIAKKADLKEYSNEETKGINDFIIQHPKIMEVVIDAAKRAIDEKSFTDWLQEALTGEGMEEGVRKAVRWEELGWAWFNTVNRETKEPTSTDVIEKLPTLDKKKKLDELLDQLSAETDPTKKEQIKQHIERIKRAKLLKADLWPAQEASENTLTQAPGQIAYQYGQQKESSPETDHALYLAMGQDVIDEYFFDKGIRWSQVVSFLKDQVPQLTEEDILSLKTDTKQKLSQFGQQIQGVFSGSEFSTTDWNVNPTLDAGPWSSPEDHGAKPQKGSFPSLSWQPAGAESEDEQPYSNVAANKKISKKELKANPDSRYWIAPDGKEYNAGTHHGAWIKVNRNLLLKQYGIKNPNISYAMDDMYKKGWVRVSNEPNGDGFQIQVQNLSSVPAFVDDIIAKSFSKGDSILIGDQQGQNFEIDDPFPSIQKAVNKKLMGTARASIKQAESVIDVGGYRVYRNPTIVQTKSLLKKSRDASLRGLIDPVTGDMYIWDAYSLEHESVIRNLYLDIDWEDNEHDFIWIVGEDAGIEHMFQKQQELKQKVTKNADLSGQVVNEILKGIETTGGITYNISQGNMAGTDNYAVSVYPQNEKIIEGPVDFDVLEGYLEANQALLQDSNNSLGVWTNGNQVYLDVVVTIPNKNKALNLARTHNQLAIYDLKNNQEIKTGIVRAFSKKQLDKKAEENLLTQEDQNEIASVSCPAYVLALNNYAEVRKRGHEKDRSIAYAIDSVKNIDKIDEKKLVEFINTYLIGLVK